MPLNPTSDFNSMDVLVTGGAGFIGSHVADMLVERGHCVDVMDNLSAGRREYVPDEATLHVLDVRSEAAADLVRARSFDALVHHAAQIDVRASVEDPTHDAGVNVLGLLNLMEAGRRGSLQNVVFASTGGAIYGEPEYTPQDETHPERPVSPYGVAKLSAEHYLQYYARQFGIDVVSLRYANVYGPRQDPTGDAGVVAIFVGEMLGGTQPVINGAGDQTRDYVYVADVARANVQALDHEGCNLVNIGTAQETSVTDLFRLIKATTGADVAEKHGPSLPGEQKRSVLDYAKAQSVLGWKPETPLRKGLGKTVEWFSSDAPVQAP